MRSASDLRPTNRRSAALPLPPKPAFPPPGPGPSALRLLPTPCRAVGLRPSELQELCQCCEQLQQRLRGQEELQAPLKRFEHLLRSRMGEL